MEIEKLQNAVENDTGTHIVKDLAILFLNAMNDWPTINQTNLEEFLDELKLYYGNSVTLKMIKNKKPDLMQKNDAWRQESGASIAKMIEISTKLENESDFETIVEKIVNHYNR